MTRKTALKAYSFVVLILISAVAFASMASAAKKTELKVSAASVLTEAFGEIEKTFEQKNPNTDVKLTFAATSILKIQVENGAPVDVFESADEKNINSLWKNGYILGKYRPIAHNKLTVIVPKANKANINNLSDLARPGLTLIGCAPEVPVGAYTLQVLNKLDKSGKFGKNYMSKVQENIRSSEANVKGIVTKVMLGDADAGICYASDVNTSVAKEVKVIPIPEQYNVLASHFIGIVKGCKAPRVAGKFIDFVMSPAGQAILKKHGMIPLKTAEPKQAVKTK